MRKFIKRYIAVFMAACVILGGWNVQEGTAQAATFSDINQDSVFLKQPGWQQPLHTRCSNDDGAPRCDDERQ